MSLTNKLTGKASVFTFNGYALPFTEYDPNFDRTLADTTDSTSYDITTDLIWEEQLPVKMSSEFEIKGWYNTAIIPVAVIAVLMTSTVAVAASLVLKSGVTFGHGNFDLSNFKITGPVGDAVTYSATLKLNGVFTFGS